MNFCGLFNVNIYLYIYIYIYIYKEEIYLYIYIYIKIEIYIYIYIYIYKEIPLSSSCVNTTVRMHHMNADKKTREEPHKNATCYIEKILVAIPHQRTAVRPLASHC